MNYTERNNTKTALISCPIHWDTPMYDLGVNGRCVGMGCSKCYEHLPVKELKYESRAIYDSDKKFKMIRY